MAQTRRVFGTTEWVQKTSTKFCSDDAQVTFESVDNVLFKIHADNLKACTGGFAPPEGVTFGEIVRLTEPSTILELLFQFIYPLPTPNIGSIEFPTLDALAEAAEKYQVYSAMAICQIYIVKALPGNPLPVFVYAAKHGYPSIMAKAAPLILDVPSAQIITTISPQYIVPWVNYHEQWSNIARRALALHRPDTLQLPQAIVTSLVGHGLKQFLDLEDIFGPYRDDAQITQWRQRIQEDIEAIPTFDKFVPGLSRAEVDLGQVLWFPSIRDQNTGSRSSFYFEDGDVTIKSVDGVLFRIHRRNLDICMPGLRSTNPSDQEISLPETASTIDVLLHFVYPLRRPDLLSLNFESMKPLTIAAEMYQVYGAMHACREYMKNTLPAHAGWIFQYAARNNYHDILDIAAPRVINEPLKTIVEQMPSVTLAAAWVQYYGLWEAITRNQIASFFGQPERLLSLLENFLEVGLRRSAMWNVRRDRILLNLLQGPPSLADLDGTFVILPDDEELVTVLIRSWRDSVEGSIREIPPFTSLL